MSLKDDLILKVAEFVNTEWTVTDGYSVPGEGDLTFSNSAKKIEICVLYADIHKSTEMVDSLEATRAAEYYKTFLHCAAKIINHNGGDISAYDGDRIMAVFTGDDKEECAVNTAFNINSTVKHIINPKFLAFYGLNHRTIKHTVGIDCGEVLVAKIGIRTYSDLVWVGSPSNYAAKLNSFDGLNIEYPTRITPDIFNKLPDRLLYYPDGTSAWEGLYGNGSAKSHYRSKSWIDLT